MTDDPVTGELDFAVALAERAGHLLVERYERVEQVGFKSARDIVTEVDHLSEALILEAIRARFPADGLLAEETGGHHGPAGEPPTSGHGRTWIVDPIDGTINYANGIPFFCVSIALVSEGCPALGVVHDPIRRETFAATAGGPATLDGKVIRTSEKDRLSDFVVSLSLSGRSATRRAKAVRRAIRVSRSMGSAALALAYAGNGRFDAFVQQGGLSLWDIAAAGLIAERAGTLVTDLADGPWFNLARDPKSISVLAAPPGSHAALLHLIRGEPLATRLPASAS
jgi:myo-inositol-1(or 4)-monophosphatase